MENSSQSIPTFIAKLWNLVDDPDNADLIGWDINGKSFHLYDQARLAKDLLPNYFKHNNLASFVRQLNMYGFKKITNLDQGTMKVERDDQEFQHPLFMRGRPDLLDHIKRKVSSRSSSPAPVVSTGEVMLRQDDVARVLTDVRAMKVKHDALSSKMSSIQRENEVLWREVAALRNKHTKQQQILSRLVQFLVGFIQKPGLSTQLKRNAPQLMLTDIQPPPTKRPCLDRSRSIEAPHADSQFPHDLENHVLDGISISEVTDSAPAVAETSVTAVLEQKFPSASSALPSSLTDIHDMDSVNSDQLVEILSADGQSLGKVPSSQLNIVSMATENEPVSQPTSQGVVTLPDSPVAPSTGTVSLLNPTITTAKSETLPSHTEVNAQIDDLEQGIDAIKEMLSGGHLLDSSVLYGLFDPEAPIPAAPESNTAVGIPDDVTALLASYSAVFTSSDVTLLQEARQAFTALRKDTVDVDTKELAFYGERLLKERLIGTTMSDVIRNEQERLEVIISSARSSSDSEVRYALNCRGVLEVITDVMARAALQELGLTGHVIKQTASGNVKKPEL